MATGFALLGGLATLFWALAAVTLWIVDRRAPRLSLTMTGVSLAFTLACASMIPPGYDEREARRVERVHAEFAPVLEQYRNRHGTYPPTLQAAGIPVPQTRYGPARYRAHLAVDGRPWYALSFGDYGYNGFVGYWHNQRGDGAWYLDM